MGDATVGLERGRTSCTELSEVLALGPGRVRRKMAGRPTARSAALPARTDLGPGARTGPGWCGVRLVPSMVPRPGRCLPASPCCDYRLSKVSPEPAPLTVEQVPLRGGRPQLRSAPSWPPRPPPRHWLGPTARAGGSAPPGTPVRPGTALVGVLAFVRCDRSASAPAPASETCCSVFLSQVSTHLFSLGPAARGMRDPCGKTQTSQLLFLWRGLS